MSNNATTIIRADRLIDGSGSEPVANPVVSIENGKIASVQSGGEHASAGEGVTVLEFPGCTIMPGLIDTHVHLNLPGNGMLLEEAMREAEGVLLATSTLMAARALDAGITTVRDVGGMGSTVIHVRRALELGYGKGARVLSCGQPITITGGHTWYFGGEADGEDGLRHKVRHMAKLGADFIKVMGSGGGTVNTISWRPSFRRSELAAIVDESHRLNRRVTVHCLCAQSTLDAVAVGVDQIEHAGFIADDSGNQVYDPAAADALARSGIPVTSTLAVGGAVVNTMLSRKHRTPDEEALLTRWQRMLAENLDQFRKLADAGVTFVAGTDAGWRFTTIQDLPLELELMNQAGYSTMEAIVAATGRAAKVIGIDGDTGTLARGKRADVIVVGGDPSHDLSVLRDLRLVMQAGAVQSGGAR